MRIRWSLAARQDAKAIREYVKRQNPYAARGITLEITRQVSMLGDLPLLGRPRRTEGTRELVISGLPYIVPYMIEGQTINILRIIHGAMRWPENL